MALWALQGIAWGQLSVGVPETLTQSILHSTSLPLLSAEAPNMQGLTLPARLGKKHVSCFRSWTETLGVEMVQLKTKHKVKEPPENLVWGQPEMKWCRFFENSWI